MKLLLVLSMLLTLSACGPNRVLVRDCNDAGPDLKNCELVKAL